MHQSTISIDNIGTLYQYIHMNVFNIERAFTDKVKRNWDKLFICVDVHDVILEGKYNLMNNGAGYMPNALKVLSNWSKRDDIVLILWTSSHALPTSKVLDGLVKHGVNFKYVNQNPECPNTELCDFGRKFYFNIGLDDKFGFEGTKDWFLIEKELKRIGQWKE
jgi:hypothetical protein